MSEEPIKRVLDTVSPNPQARVDPHPIMKEVREKCPVFYDEEAKAYLLSRYADVQQVVNEVIGDAPQSGAFKLMSEIAVPVQNKSWCGDLYHSSEGWRSYL